MLYIRVINTFHFFLKVAYFFKHSYTYIMAASTRLAFSDKHFAVLLLGSKSTDASELDHFLFAHSIPRI